MYQKNCLKHNFERKDIIFDEQLTLNYITHEEIQKYIC